jgi:hypothetical protein
VVGKKLADASFMIPIRNDEISFQDAPPEFLRGHIINGHPNCHVVGMDDFKVDVDGSSPRKRPSTEAPAARRRLVNPAGGLGRYRSVCRSGAAPLGLD